MMQRLVRISPPRIDGGNPRDTLVGRSEPMRKLARLMEQVAATRLTVLVDGETGTGKELIARGIHGLSDRAMGRFVAVNGSAIPEHLIEAEFFGHTRGAFTGAVSAREGLFEEANGGTLFIDEVSTLSPSMQVKLLRTLEDHRIRRVGSSAETPVDFRLIAATNEDLSRKVERGEFREDLLYRLNVFPITAPPLRDRADDIPELAEHFRRAFAREYGVVPPPFSPEMLDRLTRMEWPGNVRELEHFIQRAIVLRVGSADIRCVDPLTCTPKPAAIVDRAIDQQWNLAQVEEAYIQRVLERTGGRREQAASILGIDRRTLHRKLTARAADSAPAGA